jgi:hypothetical protein
MAWSALGHRMVGAIAGRHLQPATERAIGALLAGEPEPTLAGVANWADSLRDDDPQRFRRAARWHYVNFRPGSCHYEPSRDCPDGDCVLGAIEAQRALLADRRQPLGTRRDALKFLVHLVGDVHQPMHAGNRNDKGGNRFQVSLRTDLAPQAYARNRYRDGVMGTNLHAVWDYYLLATPRLDAEAYAHQLNTAPWPPKFSAGGPAVWAGESCRLGEARYPSSHAIGRAYLDAQRPLAELRIRQAAYRLATLLDATLGTASQ